MLKIMPKDRSEWANAPKDINIMGGEIVVAAKLETSDKFISPCFIELLIFDLVY